MNPNHPTSRRAFLRQTATPLLSAAALSCSPGANQGSRKPNVILIITDDQGYGDLACHGNEMVRTPNLDRLHAESVRFTGFHVDPLCAPTRAALLTGRYAYRAGVTAAFAGRSILRRGETTMAEVFSANGYRTGIFGKWHLGDNFPYRPTERGFGDTVVCWSGGVAQAADFWGNDYFDDTYYRDNQPEKFEGYCTDVFFREGLRFLEENRERPFFLYLPTNAPHAPYWVDEKYSAPYEKQGVSPTTAAFYGMIENIDENVGRLRAKLDELGLADNTILIFMTDNGTSAGTGRATEGGAWPGFDAGMRGAKGSVYEGGHRVPLFLHWPAGGLASGRDIDRLTAHIDLLPTLIDLAGLQPPRGVTFDGRSLVPLLRGQDGFPDGRVHFIQHQQFFHDGVYQMDKPQPFLNSAVLSESWRLVNGQELYDIEADPRQQTDLSSQHPETVAKLREAYEQWWAEVSGPINEYAEIVVGSDHENPTRLTSFDWRPAGGPPNQELIRQPERPEWAGADNGFWAIEVARPGRYQITLRQQPPEAQFPIDAATAKLRIGGPESQKPIPPQAQAVTFEMELEPGSTRLQTWFEPTNGASHGAYFVYVERLG